jgi:hypothetical protein
MSVAPAVLESMDNVATMVNIQQRMSLYSAKHMRVTLNSIFLKYAGTVVHIDDAISEQQRKLDCECRMNGIED